jgi:hypothetical protein
LHFAAVAGALAWREDPRFVGEIAAKIRELSTKQTALEDRLDMMIDKALKRLATLKTFKQVVAIQETRQPRKVSRSCRSRQTAVEFVVVGVAGAAFATVITSNQLSSSLASFVADVPRMLTICALRSRRR